jgi:hypothetical protein
MGTWQYVALELILNNVGVFWDVDRQILTDVSAKHAASIFRIEEWFPNMRTRNTVASSCSF